MPPTGGLGLGVDRLVMMLTGANIRQTLASPFVKPLGIANLTRRLPSSGAGVVGPPSQAAGPCKLPEVYRTVRGD
jgi:hypothetical protein